MSGFFGFLAVLAALAFIIGLIKPQWVIFWTQKKTRGTACLYLAALVVFAWIAGVMGSTPSQSTATSPTSSTVSHSTAPAPSSSAVPAPSAVPSSTAPTSVAPTTKAYSATLLPGYYEIGTDIPVGTYNFDIVSGKGNVTDTNDDVNLIMGKDNDQMYQQSYKNAELTDGAVLFVEECSIKVSSANASASLKKRDNSSAKAVSFSSGKYTAGKDFQPGYYDITLVSGSGNVTCQDNELNAIFSTDASLGVTEYKNVHFQQDNLLDIEGAKVKLTPSK